MSSGTRFPPSPFLFCFFFIFLSFFLSEIYVVWLTLHAIFEHHHTSSDRLLVPYAKLSEQGKKDIRSASVFQKEHGNHAEWTAWQEALFARLSHELQQHPEFCVSPGEDVGPVTATLRITDYC